MSSTHPHSRILRRPEVEARVRLKRSAIYRLISLGAFPVPIRLGERSVGWIESEIDAWLESRQRANEARP